MDNQTFCEEKRRTSFWGKLFGLSKKSSSKSSSDSFKRQSDQYYSFRCPNERQEDIAISDTSENFTTLENSALMEMHKDAGIIFLNKTPINATVWVDHKDDDRHVQFAPTPMNKYYKADSKSSLCRKTAPNDKENNGPLVKPILRMGKSKENLYVRKTLSENHIKVSDQKQLLNVSYIDGPYIKSTPTLQRTSTQIALQNTRQIGSLPHLNISGINKNTPPSQIHYFRSNSLERPQLSSITNSNHGQEALQNRCYLSKGRSICNIPENGTNKRIIQRVNRDSRHRLSLGAPFYDHHIGFQVRGNVASKPLAAPSHNILSDNKSNGMLHVTNDNTNKDFNKVGLPQVQTHNPCGFQNVNRHYIPLAEFSSNGNFIHSVPQNLNNISYSTRNVGGDIIRGAVSKQGFNAPNLIPTYKSAKTFNRLSHNNVNRRKLQNSESSELTETRNEQIEFTNQARKHSFLLTRYSQKRMQINKICKYKSKEAEDGFSSMADDECSFNCSCSSCISRLPKQFNDKVYKNPLSNETDMLFFSETNDYLTECDKILPPVTELPDEEEVKFCVDETGNASNSKANDLIDDSYKTPIKGISTSENKVSVTSNSQDEQKNENDNLLYENITQIINSATKQNFKARDVQKVFSTPISDSKIVSSCSQITPRALFVQEEQQGNVTSGNKKLSNISSPKSPLIFNDSILLLQEIFQKLSKECRELLQPKVTKSSTEEPEDNKLTSPGCNYVGDLVRNFQSKEISEGEFASIISGIAHSVFQEAKTKRRIMYIAHASSLPDLTKKTELKCNIQETMSLKDINTFSVSHNLKDNPIFKTKVVDKTKSTEIDSVVDIFDRQLPDGWSRSPTTIDSSTADSSSKTNENCEKETSAGSESDLQLLENAIRIGMGLSPLKEIRKAPLYSSSPIKTTKYKSSDVLSCKGKVKLKIYCNSGLVTINVMRAAKLNLMNGKDLNPYVKISMAPDDSKRVHWRTSVQKGRKSPIFNQKFSFELLSEDATKRLVFSVWHRDFIRGRSELIGCMSFSIRHVLDQSQKIDGWYRLLREGFGTQKHFAAHSRKKKCLLDH